MSSKTVASIFFEGKVLQEDTIIIRRIVPFGYSAFTPAIEISNRDDVNTLKITICFFREINIALIVYGIFVISTLFPLGEFLSNIDSSIISLIVIPYIIIMVLYNYEVDKSLKQVTEIVKST
jgi:hypothetical protein